MGLLGKPKGKQEYMAQKQEDTANLSQLISHKTEESMFTTEDTLRKIITFNTQSLKKKNTQLLLFIRAGGEGGTGKTVKKLLLVPV